MIPQENVAVYRTQNDTDKMSFILQVTTDAGVVNVADADTVVMNVRTPHGIITISGTAKGDSSGTFTFPPTTIKMYTGQMDFELQVTRASDSIIYTAATGTITSTQELG